MIFGHNKLVQCYDYPVWFLSFVPFAIAHNLPGIDDVFIL